MAELPTDPLNDAHVAKLVQFDEALRLGKEPGADPEIEPTQEFLRRLQAVWKRGTQRIGRYTIIRILGQGSTGPSYLVEDSRRRPFLLKTLWPDLNADRRAQQILLRAAECNAVLGMAKEVEAGSIFYVVLEYHPGPALAEWRLRNPQPLAWPAAAATVAKLADTLEAAHRQGIVHGNVKPTNLFLPASADVTPANLHEVTIRVAEFGFGRAWLNANSGLPWPMPQYLAPEQLSQRELRPEPASDVYALGVLLYELLTGRAPVAGITREEVRRAQRAAKPAGPSQYIAELPPALDALVFKCLQRKPSERPMSAQHLAGALRALTPEKPQPARWKQWLGWT
jgi:eukaryotic-like serine/threonine-protein kinase